LTAKLVNQKKNLSQKISAIKSFYNFIIFGKRVLIGDVKLNLGLCKVTEVTYVPYTFPLYLLYLLKLRKRKAIFEV